VLSHVFGAVDKTSSSVSGHGKIGNFIHSLKLVTIVCTAVLIADFHT